MADRYIEFGWRRRVVQQRDTLYISIPILYAEAVGIKKGEYVDITVQNDGSLKVTREIQNDNRN